MLPCKGGARKGKWGKEVEGREVVMEGGEEGCGEGRSEGVVLMEGGVVKR